MMRVLGLFGLAGKDENKVELVTKVNCSAACYVSEFESMPSCSEEDFSVISEIVRGRVEVAKGHHPDAKIAITVTGKLKGENVNEAFDHFESYYQYLQYSLLIDTNKHPDYVIAIKLLQHLKLVDCPSNQDISQEMQRMIKRELLTLPELSKGLAIYNDMYNPAQRTGEPGIGYRNEVLSELKRYIPEIKNVTLTGTRYGFIPG